jgi:hypothetical protein
MTARDFTFSVILFYVDINAGKPEKRVATTPTIGKILQRPSVTWICTDRSFSFLQLLHLH